MILLAPHEAMKLADRVDELTSKAVVALCEDAPNLKRARDLLHQAYTLVDEKLAETPTERQDSSEA